MARRTTLEGVSMYNKKNNNEQSWYTVYSFMTQDLNLYGNLLVIYAIIHGYTMMKKSCNASYKYIRNCTNVNSNSTISKILFILEKAHYIKREKSFDILDITNKCYYETLQTYDYENKCFINKIEKPLSKKELITLGKLWTKEHKKKD